MTTTAKKIQDLRNSADTRLEPTMTAAASAIFDAGVTAWVKFAASDAQLDIWLADLKVGDKKDQFKELWDNQETAEMIFEATYWFAKKIDAIYVAEEEG